MKAEDVGLTNFCIFIPYKIMLFQDIRKLVLGLHGFEDQLSFILQKKLFFGKGNGVAKICSKYINLSLNIPNSRYMHAIYPNKQKFLIKCAK